MKYFKAGLIGSAVVIALGAISFHVAMAQQGPESDSSETVAKPRKKNLPPPDTITEPAATEPATTEPPPAPPSAKAPADDNEPAVDEPKIPSKFSKKGKEVPEGTATFSSDVNTVELDIAVVDNKGHFLPNI